jgi:hypothetical protein
MKRDADPVRPVVHLVAQFVERLVQLVPREQPARPQQRGQRGAVSRVGVAAQERLPRLALPAGGERLQRGDVLRCARDATQGCLRRVAERTQHAGHVAQRQLLGAPLVERSTRFALEVDDHEVVARHQHLPQVVVAVHADLLQAAFAAVAGAVDQRLQRAPCVEHGPAGGTRLGRQRGQTGLQRGQRRVQILRQARALGREIARVERLGIECCIAGRLRERPVQLGGAATQRLHQREIAAVHVVRLLVGVAAPVLEVAFDVGHRVGPSVALVRHVGLQQCQRRRDAVCADVLQHAGHRHRVREAGHLGQETSDLDFGTDPRPQAPDALQEQLLVEHHDGVAAHRLRPSDGQRGGVRGQRCERRRRHEPEHAG